jgi:molybdopterin-containing oxidoreductase family iron-sulfur binding subunit
MSPVTIRPTHNKTPARREGGAEIRRRDALKLIASGLALSLAGCSRPEEKIIPYVDMPEFLVAGEPQFYATALPLAGFARGVIVEAVDGRPTKIAGNPRHPASLGATDIFAEAEILSLYDPDRSRGVRGAQPLANWNAFLGALGPRMEAWAAHGGEGLHLVSGRITSPTLRAQLAAFMQRHPAARLHAYEPAEGDLATLREAPRPALSQADIIVSLDADPLGPGPDQIVNGQAFAEGRRPKPGQTVNRLYVAESTRTLTGANADHRIALAPREIEAVASWLAARLSGDGGDGQDLPQPARRFAEAIARDAGDGGRVLLLAGKTLSASVRDRVEAANGIAETPSARPADGLTLTPMAELWKALEAGKVTDFFAFGCNPCHDFPNPEVERAISKVEFSAHAGMHENETSRFCRWHLALSHMLESWSDLTAREGTVSIVQPLIRPLYDTRSLHEVAAFMLGEAAPSGHEIVRGHWRERQGEAGFEEWWREALIKGVVDASAAAAAVNPSQPNAGETEAAETGKNGLVAVIRPDPSIYDGTYCNNAWLQECPKPIGKQTWSNVVALSPGEAARIGVDTGDVVLVKSEEGQITGSAYVDRGQADGVVGLTLGYGRSEAGAIGSGLGYNPRRLSPRRITPLIEGVELIATGERDPVADTQDHFRLQGELERLLPLVTQATDFKLTTPEPEEPQPSFLDPQRESDGYRWAMVIDTAACIGCNACVIACQAENNIPVVGPEEVANSRIMHWLRIDRYELGEGAAAFTGFEPVPCMQCEEAPCEPVCPVEASVHDSEGLNDQVYNRCVGTRFCQSNCPYKVRRFNWFAYGSGQEYKNLGEQPVPAQKNPEVTVRARGVMEKCTYCVQRISRARHKAIASDVPIGEGDVVTACQQACPTRAISFGNLADDASAVTRLRKDPRHFTLLEELGTRPRTTYLARVRNANPDYDEGSS